MRLVERLEELRSAAKRPLVITSGYRCREHNRAVGGSPTSLHMLGLAVDISADSEAQALLAKCAGELGFSEIIRGGRKRYIHLAIRKYI